MQFLNFVATMHYDYLIECVHVFHRRMNFRIFHYEVDSYVERAVTSGSSNHEGIVGVNENDTFRTKER